MLTLLRTKEWLNNTLKIKYIIDHIGFELVMMLVIIFNSAIVLLSFVDPSDDRGLIYSAIDNYLVVVYIVEFALKIIGMGILPYFRDNWNKLDFALIIVSLSTNLAISLFKIIRNARTAKATRILRTARINSAYRFFKVCKNSAFMRGVGKVFGFLTKPLINVKQFIHMVVLCLNLILQMVTLLVMIFHFYACVGMLVYNTSINIYIVDPKYDNSKQQSHVSDIGFQFVFECFDSDGHGSDRNGMGGYHVQLLGSIR